MEKQRITIVQQYILHHLSRVVNAYRGEKGAPQGASAVSAFFEKAVWQNVGQTPRYNAGETVKQLLNVGCVN